MFLERVVIDRFRLFIHSVVGDLVKLSGKIRRMPVRKMATVREIHRQDFVARFNRCEINRHVRLRAAVRLNVDVLRAE